LDWQKFQTVQVLYIVGAVCGILGLLGTWDSPWRAVLMTAVVVVCIAFFLFEHQKERVTVLFSGVKRYYESFSASRNADVFDQVHKQYRYFGITFDSVKNSFAEWYRTKRQGSPTIQILLSDPTAREILEFQARYETDLLVDPLTAEQQERIQRIVARSIQNIHSTLAALAVLPDAASNIEVRFHKDRARRWTHEVDSETLYLGLLRRGSTGMNSSVMVLTRRKSWTLFDHHHDGWEGLWQASTKVDLATYKGARNATI
jgi:hypothetical protein